MNTEYAPNSEEVKIRYYQSIIQKNDILITSTGEGTIGRVDLYLYDEPALADGHVTICRLRSDVNIRYVYEFLRSECSQIQMLRNISGSTGQTELLKEYIASLLIPIPLSSIQDSIVQSMDDARTQSEQLLMQSQGLQEESSKIIALAQQDMMLDIIARKTLL